MKDDKGEVKLNGRLTLGENTADNGGLKLAYMALTKIIGNTPVKHIDGYTPQQRFFLALWADLVPERDRPGGAQARAHRSTFPGTLAGERRGAEFSGLREGFRMQGRTAHGLGECLPGVVRTRRHKQFLMDRKGRRR